MATNISNNPVSDEVDPGFGPDTEQRRVEFATQMEKEAFNKAQDDALKLARTNFITVLRVLGYSQYVPLVSHLTLLEIIALWRLFEVILIGIFAANVTSEDMNKLFVENRTVLNFYNAVFTPEELNCRKFFRQIGIDSNLVIKMRDNIGGILVLSMKEKTFKQMKEIYVNVHSKLPASMRDTMKRIFGAYKIDILELKEVLKLIAEKNIAVFKNLFELVTKHFEDDDVEVSDDSFKHLIKMIEVFHKDAPANLRAAFVRDRYTKDVQDKVKSYYGVG